MTTFYFLLQSVFLGFCLWTLLWTLGESKVWKFYFSFDDIDQVAVKSAIFFGIIYLIGFIWDLPGSDRLFGKYWIGVWSNPFTYFFLTQLLWFERIRINKLIRALIALWTLFVLLFEKVVIIMTSLHRDYVNPAGNLWLDFFISLLIKVFVFALLLTVIMAVKQLIRKHVNKLHPPGIE